MALRCGAMNKPLSLALAAGLLALSAGTATADPSPPLPPGAEAAAKLKEALFAEETRANTGEAAKLYQAILDQAEAQRPIAATAAVRLGEIARKQGRVEDARAYYRKALIDFRLTGAPADYARQQLQTVGGEVPPAWPGLLPVPVMPAANPGTGAQAGSTVPNPPANLVAGTDFEQRLRNLKQQIAQSPETPFTSRQLADATAAGDLESMKLLLEHGVDPNASSGEPLAGTCIFTAVRYDQPAALDLLLKKGGKLDKRCERDTTVLNAAAWHGNLEMIRNLLDKGCDVNAMAAGLQETGGIWLPIGTPLHAIGIRGLTAAGKILIEAGANVNAACPDSGHTPLHMAARFDRYDAAQLLLENGANKDARYTGTHLAGTTPMHEAAAFGSTQTGIILADWHASINTPLSAGRPITPVHLAVRGNHLGFLRSIVTRPVLIDGFAVLPERPDYRAADEFGDTALHVAARKGSETSAVFIRWLIMDGAPLDVRNKAGLTPAELASSPAGRQDPEISAALRPVAPAVVMTDAELQRCAAITAQLPAADPGARAALLHGACKDGLRAAAVLLLDAAVPVESTTDQGRTPLMSAAAAGHPDVVKLLLDRGASINATDEAGRTALHYAAQEQKLETARVLLDRGALVNANAAGTAEDRRVWTAIGTPLTVAARWGNMDLCRLLLERGADVNFSPPDSGQTPLIAAARHGRTDAVKLFLDSGANLNATWSPKIGNEGGSTALHNATWFNCGETAKLLIKAGADFNHRKLPGTNLLTPFMLLIRENHFELAHQICTGTADQPPLATPDWSLTDSDGDTALHIAVRAYSKASPEFISWLVSRGASRDAKNKAGLTPAELASDAKLGRPQPEILNALAPTPSAEKTDQ